MAQLSSMVVRVIQLIMIQNCLFVPTVTLIHWFDLNELSAEHFQLKIEKSITTAQITI